MSTVRVYGKAAPQRAEGSPLLAGVLAGIGIIVAWVGLVYVTHHPVGVAADTPGGDADGVVRHVDQAYPRDDDSDARKHAGQQGRPLGALRRRLAVDSDRAHGALR